MLFADLVAASQEVGATRSRRRKVAVIAGCLAAMDAAEVGVGASLLAGRPRQERLDVGWATLRSVTVPPAPAPTLSILDVDRGLGRLVGLRGAGSQGARASALAALLGAATEEEASFLRGLVLGEVRHGALQGVVAQAIAAAWDVPEPAVRRALMLRADLGAVAEAAQRGGTAAVEAFRLALFRPVAPMLAATAASVAEAVTGPAAIDHKLDGARVQVHRDGRDVAVYTRNLRDVTARSAEVVAVAQRLDVDRVILDGEVLALRPDGRPFPFQATMSRFGTEQAIEVARDSARLTPFFFDCLHLDGRDLIDAPLGARVAALERVVPGAHRVPRAVVEDAAAAEGVLADALARGHEGVVVKALDAPYAAGRRGASWRKVKPVSTLDLVVLAAEWGSGRRRGWLSNLHLGAVDPAGGFVMLGKTFKGLTDDLLAWQTERFLALETHREGHTVHVRPELVVEVALDGVQSSSRYPGGVTLRFARVKRYRDDKAPGEADTIARVRALGGLDAG